MTLTGFTGFYAAGMTMLCLAGFIMKLPGMRLFRKHGCAVRATGAAGSPGRRSLAGSVSGVLLGPVRNFHHKASRAWTAGCCMYHAAIFLVVTGYVTAAAVVLVRCFCGYPVLDYASGSMHPGSSLCNSLALVFGNAEPGPGSFIYGRYFPVFNTMTLLELPLAVAGNGFLLFTVIKSRIGAVRHDLDPAARDLRIDGSFSGQHLAVRLVILSIIAMEFVGRTGWVNGIVYAHVILAFTLVGMFPFTYLSHIMLAPMALYFAVSRRRRNEIA